MSDDFTIPKIGSRWRLRLWLNGSYDYKTHRWRADGRYAPNRMTNNVIEILSKIQYHDSKGEEVILFFYIVREAAGRKRNGRRKYRVDDIGWINSETLDYCWREEVSE